jgi:hypothetical protein
VRSAVAPRLDADLRREPRLPVRLAAKVRVGFSRVCSDFVAEDPAAPASGHETEEIEIHAVMPGTRPAKLPGDVASAVEPMWQVRDRSGTGLRIAAAGEVGRGLALGVLVAGKPADADDWLVGIVRRLYKLSSGEIEAGVALIAERPVPVTLHAKREAKQDIGYVVDGIDFSTRGARFVGLYLPVSSPLAMRTLVVPTSECTEGCDVLLDSGTAVYTLRFRQLVEQGPDWSRVAVEIVGKDAKEA